MEDTKLPIPASEVRRGMGFKPNGWPTDSYAGDGMVSYGWRTVQSGVVRIGGIRWVSDKLTPYEGKVVCVHIDDYWMTEVTIFPGDGSDTIASLRNACSKENDEISQTLGRALHYPRFADDPKNFPGATDSDGVCVGEHVAATIAAEAAREIARLEQRVRELSEGLEPFAPNAALFSEQVPDTVKCGMGFSSTTVGDFRRAARLLVSTTGERG